MKPVRRKSMVLLAAICLTLVGGSGCALKRADLISDGTLALERVPEKRGYWRDIHVSQEGEELVVIGYVRRSFKPGELQVTIFSANGQPIAEKRQAVRRLRRSSRVRHARFETRFRVSPPTRAVVRLMHLRGRNGPVRISGLKE